VAAVRNGVNGVEGLYRAILIVLSPDETFLYVPGAFDNALAAFQRNPVTGMLTFVEVHRHGENAVHAV